VGCKSMTAPQADPTSRFHLQQQGNCINLQVTF
jgi:hypothetical protein